jgi:hypothetical protein
MKTQLSALSRRTRFSYRAAVIATVRREILLRGIARALESKGVSTVVYMDVRDVPADPLQLVVLGPKDQTSLDWALKRQANGTAVVPKPQLTAHVVDRVSCRALLHAAGIRTPDAVFGAAGTVARKIAQAGIKPPFVIKHRHEHGRGVVIADSLANAEEHLRSMDQVEVVVEEQMPGLHQTAYILGEQIVMFNRPPFSPAEGEADRVNDVPTDIRKAILSLRKQTGLLFGKLDLIRAADGSWAMVDAGVFPRFARIPEAPATIGGLIDNHFIAASTGS